MRAIGCWLRDTRAAARDHWRRRYKSPGSGATGGDTGVTCGDIGRQNRPLAAIATQKFESLKMVTFFACHFITHNYLLKLLFSHRNHGFRPQKPMIPMTVLY